MDLNHRTLDLMPCVMAQGSQRECWTVLHSGWCLNVSQVIR